VWQGRTTFGYYADDTVQTITDARGATESFGYNNRHLVTSISYGVPAGVGATPNVSFSYDGAGNRTGMWDGQGSVGYLYDTLSRLTSETRYFNDLGQSYTLSYSYNLAGEPTSMTNPWGAQVGYTYDAAGRATAVTGSGYAGVSNYMSNVQYRAWGGVKQALYGNNVILSAEYDSRLRVTKWDEKGLAAGVQGFSYSYSQFGENTGRVTYAQSLYNAALHHSYQYDQVGRLVASYTGTSAQAHTGQGTTWGGDGPYAQTYSYDQ
jgi:YD repeat-containing protein